VKPLQLTPRQRDVAALVVAELTRREIADRLGVRQETVGHHLKAIGAKLPGSGSVMRRIRKHAHELLDVSRETAPNGGNPVHNRSLQDEL